MPTVPFLSDRDGQGAKLRITLWILYLHSHRVDVDLLVQVVEKSNCLNNHNVDFVRRELEFKSVSNGLIL